MGTPIAQSRIQPIAPVSFCIIFDKNFISPPKKVASPAFTPGGPATTAICLYAAFFLLGNAFFFRIGDVVRAGTFKNILCALYFIAIFRMH